MAGVADSAAGAAAVAAASPGRRSHSTTKRDAAARIRVFALCLLMPYCGAMEQCRGAAKSFSARFLRRAAPRTRPPQLTRPVAAPEWPSSLSCAPQLLAPRCDAAPQIHEAASPIHESPRLRCSASCTRSMIILFLQRLLSAHVTAIPVDDLKACCTGDFVFSLQPEIQLRNTASRHSFQCPQSEKLKNGVLCASQDTKSPIATLAIAVAAGSRHETAATVGAAAYLNALAFQVRKIAAVDIAFSQRCRAPGTTRLSPPPARPRSLAPTFMS